MSLEQLKRSQKIMLMTLKNDYQIIECKSKSIAQTDFAKISDEDKEYLVKSRELLLQLRLAIMKIEKIKI